MLLNIIILFFCVANKVKRMVVNILYSCRYNTRERFFFIFINLLDKFYLSLIITNRSKEKNKNQR